MNIVQAVAFLITFVAQASRLLDASRPVWSKLPAWAQVVLPPLVPALVAFAQGLLGVKSWTDLVVIGLACVFAVLPGLPSNRSAAPLQAGKPVTGTPSSGDHAVADKVALLTDPA